MSKRGKRGKRRVSSQSEQKEQWSTVQECIAMYTAEKQPDVGIPVRACVPGSNIRGVRANVADELKQSMYEKGYVGGNIYALEKDADDEYKVIDGMHRVTALKALIDWLEKAGEEWKDRQMVRYFASLFQQLRLFTIAVSVVLDPSHPPQKQHPLEGRACNCFR